MKAILDGQEYPIKLDVCPMAEEIAAQCPMALRLQRSGGHEYYAKLPKTVKSCDAKSTSTVRRGGVYYFDAWNALALVFSNADIRPYSVYEIGEMAEPLAAFLNGAGNTITMKLEEDA